jgi:hypothetical protein
MRPLYSRQNQCPGRISFYTSDRMIYPFDHKLSIWLEEMLRSKGVDIYTDHIVKDISCEEGRLTFTTGSGETEKQSEWVILEPRMKPSRLAEQALKSGYNPKQLRNEDGIYVVGTAANSHFRVLCENSMDSMAESVSRQLVEVGGKPSGEQPTLYAHRGVVELQTSRSSVAVLGLNGEGRLLYSNEHTGVGLLARRISDNAALLAANLHARLWA